MRGYPIIFGEGVDPDAYQYFLRAGIASGTQTPTAYDNAASFNGTNQFLSIPSNSTLQSGGGDFTLTCWVYFNNVSGVQMVFSKGGSGSGILQEYTLFSSGSNLIFGIGNGVSQQGEVLTSGLVANQWLFVTCGFSSGSLFVKINQNPSVLASYGETKLQSNYPFQIGVRAGSFYINGSISSVGFWKRALTASEVTALFNNGAGRTYASLDSGLRTNLVSWWALNQNSVTADSHGTNTLTNNGTPLVTATTLGPIVTTTQNSRQLINNFVKGIKSLGLWNSMVCWPMRASQNASTTLTAQSLGGLGNFPATLANFGSASSAWTSTGLSGASTNSIATTTLSLPTGNSSRAVLAAWQNFSNSTFLPIGSTGPDANRLILRSESPTNACTDLFNGDLPNATFGSVAVPSGINFSAVSYNASNSGVLFKANSNTATSGTIAKSFASSNVIFGSYGFGATQGYGLYAFNMALNVPLDEVQIININSLYKQSLGLGLALP